MLEHSLFASIISGLDQLVRLAGWSLVIVGIWKFRGFFDRWLVSQERLQTGVDAHGVLLAETKRVIDSLTLNHLEHMNLTLIETVVQHKEQTRVLSDINTGIKVLCDR